MCSIDPDEIVEMTRAVDGVDISSGNVMCRRCNTENAVVVLRIKDAYCRDCFLSYFVHKFRSTIGKSKQIRPGDQILIATSGGLSSSALLHLIRDGLDESSHKKLRFDPAFIYIDESSLSDDPGLGPAYIDQVCSNVLALKFPCYVTSLDQIMLSQPSPPTLYTKENATLESDIKLREQLQNLLASCKNESTKQDLLEQLRRELLYQCANSLGYKKIFVADNATTLSVAILANVAKGRGSQLADRVQFKGLHKDLEVYRPMRELLLNEIQYYNDLHNIESTQVPTVKHKGSSITACTEQFVMGLQKEFPATIPTIFRTGDKLVSSSSDISKCSTPVLNGHNDDDGFNSMDNSMCVVCGLHLDTVQIEASAVNATVVSQQLSCRIAPGEASKKEDNELSSASSGALNTNDCECSQETGCCGSKNSQVKSHHDTVDKIQKNTLDGYLCYGCRITVREMGEVSCLPTKVLRFVAEQERRKQMREQIQDFLL